MTPPITFTCTTGRRFPLFYKMWNSFLETCLDRDLVADVLIADDRSSVSEINQMQRLIPNARIHVNGKGGQLESIKLLANAVKTDFIFHCEDDWLFMVQDHYIRRCHSILMSDSRIKQVILRNWKTMWVKDGEIEYGMHVYFMPRIWNWDIIKLNDMTYAGLSFNPGLIYTDVLRECLKGVTQDSPENRAWDKDVAEKFWRRGYRRANLEHEYIRHIGDGRSFYTRNR